MHVVTMLQAHCASLFLCKGETLSKYYSLLKVRINLDKVFLMLCGSSSEPRKKYLSVEKASHLHSIWKGDWNSFLHLHVRSSQGPAMHRYICKMLWPFRKPFKLYTPSLYMSFEALSKGALPPGSPHRAFIERYRLCFQSLPLHVSESPVKESSFQIVVSDLP